MDSPLPPDAGILHNEEGIDLLPANIELSGLEVTLVNALYANYRKIAGRQ